MTTTRYRLVVTAASVADAAWYAVSYGARPMRPGACLSAPNEVTLTAHATRGCLAAWWRAAGANLPRAAGTLLTYSEDPAPCATTLTAD